MTSLHAVRLPDKFEAGSIVDIYKNSCIYASNASHIYSSSTYCNTLEQDFARITTSDYRRAMNVTATHRINSIGIAHTYC